MTNFSAFKNVFSNSVWMVLEKTLRLGIGFLLTIWLARMYGPTTFGLLSFGMAWVAISSSVSRLGMEGVLVRELVSFPELVDKIMGTALFLRATGGVVVFVISLTVYLLGYGCGNAEQLIIILVLASAEPFMAAEVFEYWFRSRVEWKYAFRARVFALATASIIKVVILYHEASIFWIAGVTLLEAVLMAVLLFFEWLRHPAGARRMQVAVSTANRLFSACWPNLLSGIAIMIYMRVDQVMIGSMLSKADVGNYSVAVRLSEVWYVIPMAVCQSTFPSLVASRRSNFQMYESSLTRLTVFLFWGSVIVASMVQLIGPSVIEVLFGKEYHAAGNVLRIHFWGGCFVALGMVAQQWHLAENRLKITLIRTALGAFANIALNLLLIPRYGVYGAALATVASFGVSAYFSIALFRVSRPVWRILNLGIFIPWLAFRRN